jgi:hypothetical protein
MRTPNFEAWLRLLRTTEKPQAQSSLYLWSTDEAKQGYCCLGLGCLLVPGLTIEWLEEDYGPTDHGHGEVEGEVYFGGITDLAPKAFIDWLGLPYAADNTTGYDVWPDYPDDFIFINNGERTTFEFNPNHVSASGLNDGGFTFAQIADVFDYFGVRKEMPARA